MNRLNAAAVQYAAAVVAWLIVGMTLLAELSEPFKSFLAGLTGHHWTAKGVISVVVFAFLYLTFMKSVKRDGVLTGAAALSLSAILGGVLIFAFYVWHFLYA